MLLSVEIKSKHDTGNLFIYPIRNIALTLKVPNTNNIEELAVALISLLQIELPQLKRTLYDTSLKLIRDAWITPYIAQKKDVEDYSFSCWFSDDPNDKPVVECEYAIQISHPSKTIPWKSTGTSELKDIPKKIKMMLSTSTKLPEDSAAFAKACCDFVHKISGFELSSYEDISYDRTFNDYRVQFTLTKIKESQ